MPGASSPEHTKYARLFMHRKQRRVVVPVLTKKDAYEVTNFHNGIEMCIIILLLLLTLTTVA